MKQLFRFLSFSYFVGVFFLAVSGGAAQPGDGPVLILDINGPISPATDDYLKTSLKKAEELHARLVVIRLNTPGGLLNSTKSMVEQLLEAHVPTVVYVTPAGGSATSAGVFITLAGHVAAMTPGTTIGAAHPVTEGGQDVQGDMREKVENFAVSLIKAIAEQRGRNIGWAEKAVRESVSITDREALQEKVVDLVASDLDRLLADLEGRTVNVNGKPVSLTGLREAPHLPIELSLKQKVLNILCDPNIAILLGLGAMLGLGIELYHPGGALPGIIGVICLILSLVAAQVLPINYGGVGLLLLGGIFMIVEGFMPSFGMWGAAGIVCFVLGSLYAIDTDMVWSVEGFQVDRVFIGTMATIFGLALMGVISLAVGARRRTVSTGREGLLNSHGVVKREFVSTAGGTFEGKVLVKGELWNARLSGRGALRMGQSIRVISVEAGMVLVVEKVNDSA